MDRKMILKILIFLPLVLEVMALFFLPPEIPVHYNSSFQVDGYGSKYNVLVLGVIVIVFGFFMNWIYTNNMKTEYEKVVYRLCTGALLIFNVINLLFLYGSMMMRITVSVIGGADGPTAICLAGSVGDGIPFVLLFGIIVVLMGIVILKLFKKKK